MPTARRYLILSLLATLALTVSACGSDSDEGAAGSAKVVEPAIEVVATTPQIGDFVRSVGRERVEVTQILDPTTDPHGFEPRFSDVAATTSADIVFYNGEDLDPWAESLVADSDSQARLVDLSSNLPALIDGEGHGHEHGEDDHDGDDHGHDHGDEHDHVHDSEYDPHWWHNPHNAVGAVATITTALAAVDREGAAEYRQRARDYTGEILDLDERIEACIDRLPPQERNLVTDHEAFGYLADRYGLNVVGAVVPAMTTQAQASARDISDLIATIERLEVKAIFPEQSVNAGVARTIAEQTGATADLTLYGDTLGAEGSGAETYLQMMAANAETIADGLSGGETNCEMLLE